MPIRRRRRFDGTPPPKQYAFRAAAISTFRIEHRAVIVAVTVGLFGAGLQVGVGGVRVPAVNLSNMTGMDELGPHRYDNGLSSIDTSDGRGWVDSERNGLVYTCRGGSVDTAHVRDNADQARGRAQSASRIPRENATLHCPRPRLRILKPCSAITS
jgi:hypothetical protein